MYTGVKGDDLDRECGISALIKNGRCDGEFHRFIGQT